MKNIQLWFNKNSRFSKAPDWQHDAGGVPTNKLMAFNPNDFSNRVGKLLKKQNDFFPCFDWAFPPPLLKKHDPVTTTK